MLSTMPLINASVVSLIAPRDVTSGSNVWKNPAGPEWEWVPDITTFFSVYLK